MQASCYISTIEDPGIWIEIQTVLRSTNKWPFLLREGAGTHIWEHWMRTNVFGNSECGGGGTSTQRDGSSSGWLSGCNYAQYMHAFFLLTSSLPNRTIMCSNWVSLFSTWLLIWVLSSIENWHFNFVIHCATDLNKNTKIVHCSFPVNNNYI